MPVPMPPKNTRRNSAGDGSRRPLSFWILIILIPVVLIQLSGAQVRGVEADHLHAVPRRARRTTTSQKVTITAGKTVNGTFKQRDHVGGNDSVKNFTVRLPGRELGGRSRRAERAQGRRDRREGRRASRSRRGSSTSCRGCSLIGFYLFLFKQMQAGGAKAFSFGKSKAKLLTGDTPKVTFADVAGADEAKQELQEIIEFLRDPQKFTKLGGRLPKGALLVGPPGTGKTLLAQRRRRRGRPSVLLDVGLRLRRDVRRRRREPRARSVRAGQGARAVHHLHRRDRRRRPPSRRRPGRRSRRARADAQPAARRDGRLRVERRRDPHRRDEPSRRARSGAAASGPLRPTDRRRRAGSPRPRGNSQGPPAQQADRRRRGHHDAGARHAGHGGRRSREPRQRGGAARRPSQPRQDLHGRPRGRQGQGHARRRAEVDGDEGRGAPAHGVPRSAVTPSARCKREGQRSAAQGDDRAARPRAWVWRSRCRKTIACRSRASSSRRCS